MEIENVRPLQERMLAGSSTTPKDIFPMNTRISLVAGTMLAALAAQPALAQIKPESSGDPSFLEPKMRRHGSGFVHPNRPHRHTRHNTFFR